MQKIYNRYAYPLVLVLVIVFLTAGCVSPSRQSEPENPGHQVQQEEQDQLKTAGDPNTNQNSRPQAKGQDKKTAAPVGTETPRLLPATVTRVVDGDTVHITLPGGKEEKVRFIGVDTPESTKEAEPYGKEASDYTESRLDGRKIWLELDLEERDRYGRLLAYAWLERPADEDEAEVRAKMYNAELLLNGCAQVMTVPPNVKYAELFVKLQQEARETNKGLWDTTRKEMTVKTEDYYVASVRSNKYHRPGCEWGQKIAPANLIKFKTVDNALDTGYEPCRVCKP